LFVSEYLVDFFVEKGSVVFLNNYELNTSATYWEDPQTFDPSRFVRDGRICKPEYFIPFSTGRRACMGHKIVQNVTFLLTAKLFAEFDIKRPDGDDRIDHMQPACLAVPPKAFSLVFAPRIRDASKE
jgi:cytochrome P450 family 307 subfamily A